MDNINKIIINCKKEIKFWPNYEHFIVDQLSDFIHNQSNDDEYIIKTNKIPLLYFFDKYLNEEVDDNYYITYRYNINIFVNKQAELRIKAHEIIDELNHNDYHNMINTFDIFLNRVRLNNI